MAQKIVFISMLSVLALASQSQKPTLAQFTQGSQELDTFISVKPLQAIILGYLDDLHDRQRATVVENAKIHGVAYSPDGMHMATVTEAGDITIRDAHTNQIIKQFNAGFTAKQASPFDGDFETMPTVRGLAYTPQNYLICSQQDANIETKIWDASDSYKLLKTHLGISQILYNKQGVSAEIAKRRRTILKLHLQSKLVEHEFMIDIYSAAISPDQSSVVVFDGMVTQVFDLSSGKIKGSMETGASHLAISPDGKYMTAGHMQSLDLWDFEKLKLSRNIIVESPNNKKIRAAIFSPDGKYLVYAIEKILYFYDLVHEKTVEVQLDEDINFRGLCYLSDWKYLAVATGKRVQILTTQAHEIERLK